MRLDKVDLVKCFMVCLMMVKWWLLSGVWMIVCKGFWSFGMRFCCLVDYIIGILFGLKVFVMSEDYR